jgi:hypothetical protein
MNSDHFAIVIGLASYPELGDPPPANLLGPENDADAIVAWLSDPKGGALPASNIWSIRSRDLGSPPSAAPKREKLEEAFSWLDDAAEKSLNAGKGRKVGTRLYFYASGHGFSPGFGASCLLTGDATERKINTNISPSAWLDWLRDADYFSEYILWMDACMDRQILTPPAPPPLKAIGASGQGRTFIAYAAPRPLKAAEKEIPPGGKQWHGVFTWNLLEGLRGAATNEFGLVTAGTLADWLRQAQLGWLDDADRSNPAVAKEPSIGEKDDGIVFGAGSVAPSFEITLTASHATTPITVRLWSGVPASPGPAIAMGTDGVKVQLTPGLYLAEGAGLRHGFAVTRSMAVDLVDRGDPVKQSNGKFTLQIDPGDASADITLLQETFNVILSAKSQLLCPLLQFGLYECRIRIGRQIIEKIILLDSNWPPPPPIAAAPPPSAALPPLPQITSAAPLPGTRSTREYQRDAASEAANDMQAGAGAELMVMARWFSTDQRPPSNRMPWQGVTLTDAKGALVADLEKDGRHEGLDGDPVGVCTLSLSPGAYELCYPLGSGSRISQSLILPAGAWRSEAYVLYDSRDLGAKPSASLLMRKQGAKWGTGDDIQLQKALVALADERPIENLPISDLLAGNALNPLAAIVAGHLLVLSAEQAASEAKVDLEPLNDLVRALRESVGADHPDVEALSLRCPNLELRTKKPISAPPMFERSWELLLNASQERPDLIPSELWSMVHARASAPPYLAWSPDAVVKAAYAQELANALFRERPSPAAGNPPNSLRTIAHAVQAELGGLASRVTKGLGRITAPIETTPSMPPSSAPQQFPLPGPANIPEQEVSRRARALHLPPAAVDLLGQKFNPPNAAQKTTEQGPISGGL